MTTIIVSDQELPKFKRILPDYIYECSVCKIGENQNRIIINHHPDDQIKVNHIINHIQKSE